MTAKNRIQRLKNGIFVKNMVVKWLRAKEQNVIWEQNLLNASLERI